MRIIVKFEKGDSLRFISHLDLQRAFHRAIKRADIPIAYSQGFNPHPKTSFASALPVGQTGCGEWMEILLSTELSPDEVKTRLNRTFPSGLLAVETFMAKDGYPSLSACMCGADYTAVPIGTQLDCDKLSEVIDAFLSQPIMVEKRKKSKGKPITVSTDIRPAVISMKLSEDSSAHPVIKLSGRLDASGGLNADMLFDAFSKHLGLDINWRIQRDAIHLNPAP